MRPEPIQPAFIRIPTELITDSGLTWFDGVLFGYIWWYTKLKKGRCFASNETLAKLGCSKPKTVQNSLTRLERRGYIQREFFDGSRKKRAEIIPLCDNKGLSLNRDRVSPNKDRGLSLNLGQKNSSPLKKSSEGKLDSPPVLSLLEDRPLKEDSNSKSVDSVTTSEEKTDSTADSAAEDLVRHLCKMAGMKRPDRGMEYNLAQARQLIELIKEKTKVPEAGAISCAQALIELIAKGEPGFDRTNMTHTGYLVKHFNRLINEQGLDCDSNGIWYFN